ncbi:MAG: hypothetical protein IJW14_00265 [Oscillospiraceae bacterium]|nr:hypothetical protein [Oscillospiraceae bacterium]
MKLLKIFICITIVAVLLMTFPGKAASSNFINYHELFVEYTELDGMAASKYEELVYSIYLYNPEQFIGALSNEDNETIVHHSLNLSYEMSNPESQHEVYESSLNTQLSDAPEGSALANTLKLMLYADMVYQTAEYKNSNYLPALRSALQNDSELFITVLNGFKGYLPELIDMMTGQLSNDELDKLDRQFADCTSSDWITDDKIETVNFVRAQIEEIRNTPPSVTEPEPTEPTTLPTAPPSNPTEAAPEITPQEEPNHLLWIAASVVGIALIVLIIILLYHKKKAK